MSAGLAQRHESALRICLDANIWIAFLIAVQNRKYTSAAITIVHALYEMQSGGRPLQLVISYELLDTIIRVGLRLGYSQTAVEDLVASIVDLMKEGPEQLDPALLLSGRDQLAIHDREDAGVLAACIAARADLLVTDNLRDFETNDSERIDTRKVSYQLGGRRQLYAIIHTRSDGVFTVVMHPLDALEWVKSGKKPTPHTVKKRYAL